VAVKFKSPAIAHLVERLRPYLHDYLVLRGIEYTESGWFKCINPEHDDKNPSMHLNPVLDGLRAICFSCGFRPDIFKACATLEGRPESGPGWVYQNVYHLAKLFKLDFEEIQPTEEELLYMQQASLYDDAAAVLSEFASNKDGKYVEYCLARGLTKETCKKFVVAEIPYSEFLEKMKVQGHGQEMCERYGLGSDMFDKDRVTFLLRDDAGAVVGFARRYIPYDKEAARLAKMNGRYYPAKFSNTSSAVPFFDKRSFLYGMYLAKGQAPKRLDLYEGYFDVMFAHQSGINNSVGVCGTSFTDEQIKLIRKHGFTHANLVFDSEDRGNEAARAHLDAFDGQEGLYLTVMFLPFEDEVLEKDRDPDQFIKLYGVEAYNEVEPLSAFEWKLHDLVSHSRNTAGQPTYDGPQICEQMLPFILAEPSKIRQAQLIGILANATQVKEDDIVAEVNRRTDKAIVALADDMAFRLTRAKDAKQKAEIITTAYAELSVASSDIGQVDLTWAETHEAFLAACAKHEAHIEGIAGWKTGWPKFDDDFDGLPKEGQVFGIAGGPNVGKSAFLGTLTTNLLINNPEGLSVIFHILDDPRNIAFAKLMSCLTSLPIRAIVRANRYILSNPALLESYVKAKDWLAEAMKTGRLVIKGQEMGNSTDVSGRLIDEVINKTGNQVVYFVDSLHSLDDKGGNDERIRFKRVAEWCMRMTETRRMSMVATVELTKMGMEGRPRLQHLAETGKLQYAMKAVGLLYNELHDRRQNATTFWVDESESIINGRTMDRRPIIEIEWAKNKVSEFKGAHYLKFYEHVARVEEMSLEDLKLARETAAKLVAQQPERRTINNAVAESLIGRRSGFALGAETNGLES
jgi:DNA primase catalytic core